MEYINISIIGSANGKGLYDDYLNESLFQYICNTAENFINNKINNDWSKVHIISGGASWADHAAVVLYLKHPSANLTLHLPCTWDSKQMQFTDNGSKDWRINPGKLTNDLHNNFSKIIKNNTLAQIQQAINNGCKIIDTYKGFHHRNLAVGVCNYLIAFTFSEKQPTDGGTGHTWKNAKCPKVNKIHFTLPKKEN